MPRQEYFDTAIKPERAILVGVITPDETEAQVREYLEELEFLVDTAGGITEKTFTQKMSHTDRRSLSI